MVTINSKIEIRADAGAVWDIVSDLDSEPKFWKGTKSVRNVSKQGNIVDRYVTIAFKDKVCRQKVTLYPKERIEFVFTEGIISGNKVLTITANDDHTVLEVVWDIRLAGVMGMFMGMIKGHIRKGTEQALDSIMAELER